MTTDNLNLLLKREIFNDECTHGVLYINNEFECFTLEDIDRKIEDGGSKIYGSTAIPRGSYKVDIDFSNRFQKSMIHILNVPGFSGIRIHAGNTSSDTEGCVLVGMARSEKAIYQSKKALDALFKKVQFAIDSGTPVNLEVA